MLNVNVIVISVTSTNPQPIKKFVFSAAVPKVILYLTKRVSSLYFLHVIQSMRVKLQSASSNELNGYNPILPMSAITQVMLIANPTQVKEFEEINQRFRVNF